MKLEDLLDKPNSELTDEELETKEAVLSQLKFRAEKKPATNKSQSAPRAKSNKEKQAVDLIKQMTPEQLAKFKEALGV